MSMDKHGLKNKTLNFSPSKNRLLGFIFLTILLALIYSPVLLGHASLKTNSYTPSGPLFVGDPLAGGSITVPLEYLVTQAWSHLQLPAIDPFQGFGIPLLSSQSVPVFFPEIITHMLFPSNYSIWNFLRLDFLAYGTFLLAFSFDFGLFASLAAGIGSALAGVAPPNVNLEMLNPLMVLPFILLALRYLLDPNYKNVKVAWLGLVTSVTLMALSGFQELFPLLAVLITIFALAMAIHYRVTQLAPRRLIATFIGGVVALVIGAIGYLPTLSIVTQGFGVNTPTAHLLAAPSYWLGTLTIPKINGASLVDFSPKHTYDIWILGTPVLLMVILLAIISGWKYLSQYRFIVIPSVLLILVGILCFSNELGILHIFGFFPFNSILMNRFFGFIWWIPWCLLLALVISSARKFSLADVLVTLVISIVIDTVMFQNFTAGSHTDHINVSSSQSYSALGLAITVLIFFAVSIHLTQRLQSAWPIFIIFTAATLLSVPTNFFPKGSSQAATGLSGANTPNSNSLVDFSEMLQPPTNIPAINALAPIISPAYMQILDKAFPTQFNYKGYKATSPTAPTLFFVGITPRLLSSLASFGVNKFAIPTPLNLGTSISSCSAKSSAIATPAPNICLIGKPTVEGHSPFRSLYLYKLNNVDPLVFQAKSIETTSTQKQSLNNTIKTITPNGQLPTTAFITDTSTGKIRLATGIRGIKRTESTEKIITTITTQTKGLVILRNSDLPGISCSVNGQSTKCLSVDGGLWVAVQVPKGTSKVALDYVSGINRAEEYLSAVGLLAILIAWIYLGLRRCRTQQAQNNTNPITVTSKSIERTSF